MTRTRNGTRPAIRFTSDELGRKDKDDSQQQQHPHYTRLSSPTSPSGHGHGRPLERRGRILPFRGGLGPIPTAYQPPRPVPLAARIRGAAAVLAALASESQADAQGDGEQAHALAKMAHQLAKMATGEAGVRP